MAGAKPDNIRKTIVNPARLNAERQMDVCMQCHLDTTSFRLPNSIVRYDRGPFSYHPGEPLSDFMLHFDRAPANPKEDRFEIASQAYRLRRSACFQKSDGTLRCTTCHNPHDVPRGPEATQRYSRACRECHGVSFNQLVARVQRYAEAQWQIEAALQADPNLAEAHELLGNLTAAKGQFNAALSHYREAIRIRPEFGRALLDLGSTLADLGDSNGALPYVRKAAQSSDPAVRDEAAKMLQQMGSGR